jgi:hypothetical protein
MEREMPGIEEALRQQYNKKSRQSLSFNHFDIKLAKVWEKLQNGRVTLIVKE